MMQDRSGELDHIACSRRGFLRAGAAVGGGLLLGFSLPTLRTVNAAAADTTSFAPNAFINIDHAGTITLIMPQVEMGQGTYTSLPMILAEELDADWKRVRFEHAPPDEAHYANPMLTVQATGNSNSVRAFWKPLRQAGANARALLVQAAAEQLKATVAELRTEESQVIYDKADRKIAYGDLVDRAAALTLSADAPLKGPKDFHLIGRPLKRLDTPDKTNGKARYGIDARPPGVKFATLAASPVLGGRVAHVDDTKAKTMPGVRQIVVLDNLVAVVGDHMWAAMSGLDALQVNWDDGVNDQISTNEIWDRLRKASARDGAVARQDGDPIKTLSSGDIVTQTYEMPLLAHACMEPMNCTAHVTTDGCELWIGTQVISRVQSEVAKAIGLPVDKVIVHQHLLGGGFGRRLEPDMAISAARIAQKVDGPVKVVWTREEDIRHDIYRPAYHNILSAKLDGDRIVAWKDKVSGSAVMARWLPPFFQKGVDPDGVDSARDVPYDIPNVRVEFNREEPPGVNTGFWRGVGPNNNVFAIESFIDELAKKAGKDPIAFRLANLDRTPRLKAVLQMVGEKSGWSSAPGPRRGRGVAAQVAFASFIATVVECEVDEHGEVVLHRITSVVDTGTAVNPDTIVAQLQGGLIFGLSAALWGNITLEKGRVRESNFHDYRVLRMNEVPPTNVHLIRNGEPPGGIGETGAAAGPPALRNAIYAATGVALRRLPIDRSALAVRKQA